MKGDNIGNSRWGAGYAPPPPNGLEVVSTFRLPFPAFSLLLAEMWWCYLDEMWLGSSPVPRVVFLIAHPNLFDW